MLLVNCVGSSVEKLGITSKYIGSLITPRSGDTEEKIIRHNLTFGADNDAFSGFHFDRYIDMLQRLRNWGPQPLWVTLPDVVGDSQETMILAEEWASTVRNVFNFKAAYVIQDGQTVKNLPWELADAIFIGGTTGYKLGYEVRKIVREANKRNIWVHMGRVNTRKRIVYAHQIGCDSVDGSAFSMYRDTHLPWAIQWLEELGDHRVEQLDLAI